MAETPETTKPKLTPANENPWYCLMTLHGEQPEGADWFNYDKELHAKNRSDWNRWAARALSEAERKALLDAKDRYGNPRFSPEELTPHSATEWDDLVATFQVRTQGSRISNLPEHDPEISLPWTDFVRPFLAQGLLFPAPFGLRGATFSCTADLSGATFSGDAMLSGSTFSDTADLSGAIIYGNAYLSGSTFSDTADLSGATFSGIADLSGATFSSDAYLSGARFLDDAHISGARFSGDAYFSDAKFSRKHFVSFETAAFADVPDFLNAELEGKTTFARATFKTHPPSFHGARLNEGTAFDEVTWPDPPSLPAKPVKTGNEFKDNSAMRAWEYARNALEDDIKCYQRLKQIMETLKKHEDELEFFAREMACKQVLHRANGETGKAWLLEMYGTLSDYGRSVARPTVWMVIILAYSAVMMAAMLRWTPQPQLSLLPSLSEAFHLTYANLLSPLNIRKDFFDPELLKKLPIWVQLISGFQTIAGVFFTFLIGLGLRNRFRMK